MPRAKMFPNIQLPKVLLTHVIDWLFEAGICSQGMNGPVPLSWQELAAWSNSTSTPLSAWEARTIHLLSNLFCDQFAASKSLDTQNPLVVKETKDASISMINKFDDIMSRKKR